MIPALHTELRHTRTTICRKVWVYAMMVMMTAKKMLLRLNRNFFGWLKAAARQLRSPTSP